MSETGKLPLASASRVANIRTLMSAIDSSLERRTRLSINLDESTIGVSVDIRGDWTISIGLSMKSDRFHVISSGLEALGFFQATENEGTSYFIWTSVLAQTENVRSATEQVLAQAVKILQTAPVSQYIS